MDHTTIALVSFICGALSFAALEAYAVRLERRSKRLQHNGETDTME